MHTTMRFRLIGFVITIFSLLLIPAEGDGDAWLGFSPMRWIALGLILVSMLVSWWVSRKLHDLAGGSAEAATLPDWMRKPALIKPIGGLALLVAILLSGMIVYLWASDSIWFALAVRSAPPLFFFLFLFILFARDYTALAGPGTIQRPRQVRVRAIRILGQLRQSIQDRFHAFIDLLNARMLAGIIVLLPALGTILLLQFGLDSGVNDFFPQKFDDVDYWRESNSFITHGFSFGPYSTNEQTAPAQFSNFGLHGPAYPVFYGMLGKLVGWKPATPVWLNLGLITLALAVFVWLVKPDKKHMFALLILELTFWPFWLFLPRNMQEIVHLSFGLVIAGLWVQLLKSADNRRKSLALLIVILCAVSLMRFTWAVLLLGPLVILWPDQQKTLWLRIGVVAALFLASAALFTFWNVPWPTFSFWFFSALTTDPVAAWELFHPHLVLNLNRLVYQPADGWFVMVFRYQVVLMAGYAVWALWRDWRRSAEDMRVSMSLVVAIWPSLLLVLAFNDLVDTRDYRTFAPYMLVAFLLLIFSNRYRWFIFMVVLQLAAVGSVVEVYQSYQADYQASARVAESRNLAEQWESSLVFDPEGDRWCNSLLVEYGWISEDNEERNFQPSLFMLTDPGIGIGLVTDWQQIANAGLKSKYIFADPVYMARFNPGVLTQFNLEPIDEYGRGVLYLNLDSGCQP